MLFSAAVNVGILPSAGSTLPALHFAIDPGVFFTVRAARGERILPLNTGKAHFLGRVETPRLPWLSGDIH